MTASRDKRDPASEERARVAKDRRDFRNTNSSVVFFCLVAMFGIAIADATFIVEGLIWVVGFVANFINYLFENSPWTEEEAKSATKTLIYCGYIVAFFVGIYANRQNNTER